MPPFQDLHRSCLGRMMPLARWPWPFCRPTIYPLWKTQLRDGHTDPGFAVRVASSLARIHAATAADPGVAGDFPTDAIIYGIRLEPYLVATGRAHPDLANRFDTLVATTQAKAHALVHGDVSPKNILCGPHGPVFLLAFCLNHLLLKCLWTPTAWDGFLACFEAMVVAYLAGVTWEAPAALETRVAGLLPGLLLARIDGKSPVEYITAEADKDRVRRVARALLNDVPERLQVICQVWRKERMQ
jgi:hypothetical protein